MACPSPDYVLDYLAGKLGDAARDDLDAHVDRCTTCRQLIVELARTDMDAAVRPAKQKSPHHIGRYKVESKLGEGGMGTVYAAYDSQLDRRVAVKLVHPELADIGGVERLVREGRALARLAHPNVVAVHDAGTDDNRVYIAMELVEGTSLAAWLREAPRHWRQITEKFVEAGRGIAAAHDAGIIHRDIKPENVLLDRNGHVKVADFGLAGHSEPPRTGDHDTDRLTMPGAVMGTPMYMSPEQRRGQDVSFATDQYSLCAALDSALHQHRGTSKPPKWLRAAIAKGLAQESSERYASIAELVAAIDPARRTRRYRMIAVAAAAAGLIGGVAAAFYLTREHDDTAAVCAAEHDSIDGVWRSSDRSAIADALRATKVTYAEDTATRVANAIDIYVKDLESARVGLCRQRPRSSEDRALFDQGIACIAERRGELVLLRDRLRKATATDVRLAVSLVHELPYIDDCADYDALAAEARARATPSGIVTRRQLADAIRDARSAARTGAYQQAIDHATRGVALARTFGGRLLARALIVQGEVMEKRVGAGAAVERIYRDAVAEAEAGRADDLRAMALTSLAASIAFQPGREREAVSLEPLVTAAIARAKKQRAYLPRLHQTLGVAKMRMGEVEQGLASFQTALAKAREVFPADDPRMPEYVYPVGVALSMLQRDAEALKYQEEAYRVAVSAYGADHPHTARFMINLAAKHASLGDCPKAIDELTRARALLTGAVADDSDEQLQVSQTMGACYYILKRHDDAIREYTRRQQALIAANRTRSAEMASSWVDIGDVQLDRGDLPAGAASYRKSIAAYEDLLGLNDVRLALPLWRLGETELRMKHPERALEPLERATALYAAAKAPAVTAADAWSRLAYALWSKPASRGRARELAKQARDAYIQGGKTAVGRAAELDKWLETHK